MTPPKTYRRESVEIEAMQLIDSIESHYGVYEWVVANGGKCMLSFADTWMIVKTPEGDMRADLGDYVIRDAQGYFYRCDPDVFEATYEPAEDR